MKRLLFSLAAAVAIGLTWFMVESRAAITVVNPQTASGTNGTTTVVVGLDETTASTLYHRTNSVLADLEDGSAWLESLGSKSVVAQGTNAAGVPMVARGAVGQSANIFEVQASNNATLFGVGPTGAVTAASFSGAMSYTNITGSPIAFDVVSYGADPTGVADSTASIQSAIDAAGTAKGEVLFPSGTYLVSSTLTYAAPMRGVGLNWTTIRTTATNGTPVIDCGTTTYVSIQNLALRSPTDEVDGNFTGIKLGSSRWILRDVLIQDAAVGLDINGWDGVLDNVRLRFGGTGITGNNLNACRLDVELVGNVDGLVMTNSWGTTITGHFENQTGDAIRMSKCGGINIDAYFEDNVRHMNLGDSDTSTDRCVGIKVIGNRYVGGSIRLNNVTGFSMDRGTSAGQSPVVVTALAAQYEIGDYGERVSSGLGQVRPVWYESTPLQKKSFNYFPNPFFRGGIRGWPTLSVGAGATVSAETNITIHGSALRMDWTNQTYYPSASFYVNSETLAMFKGKTAHCSAWIWIPDTADFQYTYPGGTPKAKPAVIVKTGGGAAPAESSVPVPHWTPGAWNQFVCGLAIPDDTTSLMVRVLGDRQSGTTQTEDSYIVVGEVLLTIDPVDDQLWFTSWEQHPVSGSYRGVNNWTMFQNALPASSNQTYIPGDRVERPSWAVVGSGGFGTTDQKYVVTGWRRLTTGTAHTVNTDWVEERLLTGGTGTADAYQPTNSNLTLLSSAGAGSALQVLRKASGNTTMEWATISAGGLDEAAASLLYQGTNSYLTDLGDGSVSALTITTLTSDTHNVGTLAITNPLLYLPATNVWIQGSLTNNALTSTRVPFSNASKVLSDDADLTFATDTLYGTKITSTDVRAGAILSTNTLTIPNSDDTDVTAAGQISWDTDGWLRSYDGANQVAIGRKIETIQATIMAPNDLADAVRDACLIWSNESGMSFVITGWKAWSGTDNTTLNIETTTGTGGTNATVDAVEIATDGTGCFYASDATITAGTIANGSLVWLDFDDTDTPTWVKVTIYGYYDANVN